MDMIMNTITALTPAGALAIEWRAQDDVCLLTIISGGIIGTAWIDLKQIGFLLQPGSDYSKRFGSRDEKDVTLSACDVGADFTRYVMLASQGSIASIELSPFDVARIRAWVKVWEGK